VQVGLHRQDGLIEARRTGSKETKMRLPMMTLTLLMLTNLACNQTEAPTEPEPMNPLLAQRVAVIERRLAATNQRDFETWMSLHTEGACRTAPELPEPLCGRAAMRGAIEILSRAFPDYHLELVQVVAQGDWLSLRIHTSGTMTGPLLLSSGLEVPPTGRTIDQEWSALVHFEGVQIAQFDEYYDQYTLMVQLGIISE